MPEVSVNLPPGESDLARLSNEQIEALFGAESVLPIGGGKNFRDALEGHWKQPLELFSLLMCLLLLALAMENLLANKFYRQDGSDRSERGKGAERAKPGEPVEASQFNER